MYVSVDIHPLSLLVRFLRLNAILLLSPIVGYALYETFQGVEVFYFFRCGPDT